MTVVNPPYLRQLLAQKYDWIESKLHQAAQDAGYGQLTPALTRLFGYIRKKPISISDLARKMMISRQAVHKLLIEAQTMGYVELLNDPQDKRIKLVKFTDQGLAMSQCCENDLHNIELTLARVLGDEDLADLKRILNKNWDVSDENKCR